MTAVIQSIEAIGKGLFLVESFWAGQSFGPEVWAECTSRKLHRCIFTGAAIPAGGRQFRPVTNKGNRMWRASPAALTKAAQQ